MPGFEQCYCQDLIQDKLYAGAKVTEWGNLYWVIMYKSVKMLNAYQRERISF